MSEKRFIVDYLVGVLDKEKDRILCDCQGSQGAERVVCQLNELNDENERLKQQNKYNLEDCNMEIAQLRKENEQLKEQNNKYLLMMNSNAQLTALIAKRQ